MHLFVRPRIFKRLVQMIEKNVALSQVNLSWINNGQMHSTSQTLNVILFYFRFACCVEFNGIIHLTQNSGSTN